jgi:hypothetical protein
MNTRWEAAMPSRPKNLMFALLTVAWQARLSHEAGPNFERKDEAAQP